MQHGTIKFTTPHMPQRKRTPTKRTSNMRNNMLRTQAKMTRGTPDPIGINPIVCTYRGMTTQNVASGSLGVVTPSVLIAFVPGGAAAWARFRLLHVEIWGPSTLTSAETNLSSVTLEILGLATSGIGADQATFTDHGTHGSRRAHLSIRPASMFELSWFSTADTATNLFQYSTNAPATATDQIVLQFTVELRSV